MRRNVLRKQNVKTRKQPFSYGYPAPILYRKSAFPRSLNTKSRSLSYKKIILVLFYLTCAIGVVFGVLSSFKLIAPYFITLPENSTPELIEFQKGEFNTNDSLELPELSRSSIGIVRHKVKRGETLSSIIRGYGLSYGVVQKVSSALKQAQATGKGSYKIFPGQEMELGLDAKKGLVSLSLKIAPGIFLKGKLNATKHELETKLVELPRKTSEVSAHGTITSSFAAAAAKAHVSYEIVDELVDLFGSKVLFHKDFRVGDYFTLVYDKTILEDGTLVAEGPLKAALLSVNGTEISAIRYVGADKKARYFDANGDPLGNTFLRYPLKFSRISSVFSDSRLHPITKKRQPHYGVDFAAPTGTPVRASADGKVLFAGRKGPNGIMIKLQHGTRYKTAYCHLSKISKGIRRGKKVTRGQIIGAVGSTGRSTGPHLHYGFFDRNKYVDPLKVKLPLAEQLTKGTRIPKDYLKRALTTLKHYHNKVSR